MAETPTPTKGTQAWLDYAREQYGWIADLYDAVPEPYYRDWETDRKSTRLNSSH